MGKPEIGEGTWIGEFVIIEAVNDKVIIGRKCDISDGVKILTHSTHLRCVEQGEKITGSVIIGNHVFIGANTVVLPNVKIGHHSIVGALSLLKDLEAPPYSLISGIPAQMNVYKS